MVKPLTFKGDKKSKKRKRQPEDAAGTVFTEGDDSEPKIETAAATEDDQIWVSADQPSEITGPIVIVLPSSPPTCVACDANGKVFASELVNIIEGNSSTAEPHDVRQVWVATKVPGTNGIHFKGHHGRYLSCDKHGILSAEATAISSYESFIPVPAPDTPGMMSFQVHAGDDELFLSIKEGKKAMVEIRGDASEISFVTSFRVRMQARYKPKSKSAKESKALEKISRKELEAAVGRPLEDHEVKRLKKARREGKYHEALLDVRVKGKHDKFA